MRPWTTAQALVRSWKYKTGAQTDRMAILQAVWDKELGHMAPHWKLSGIRKGFLYIVPRSPAAAMELKMRGEGIIRGLNKYFKAAWIKGIRTSAR